VIVKPDSQAPPLEATSPFDLRVNLSRDVPETDVRTALASGDMGFLHSFTTGSAVDGPGIRVVAWTAGCMWRCQYPDTWTLRNGIPVATARALEELRKYRQGLKVMAGGVTISGGEPLMQDRFVVKLLAGAKAMGIHTAIESNGYLAERLCDVELATIDLVMLGIKTWDPERHKRLTGREIDPTLAFARRLAQLKRPIWVRFVLVPGLTDSPADITNIARFAARLGNVERIDVLPFHQMGRYKWERLKLRYMLHHVRPPSSADVERAVSLFRNEGLTAY
jgi:pyruvate formate lyase activating enzyme